MEPAWNPGDYVPVHGQQFEDTTLGKIRLTSDDALMWLKTMNWERQRALQPTALARLHRDMALGQFGFSTLQVGVVNGQRYLIDGQHRLTTQVGLGLTLTYGLITHYFADEDEMAKAYADIDTNSIRNLNTAYRAFNLAEGVGLTGPQVRAVGAAVRLIDHHWASVMHQTRDPRTKLELINSIRDWADAAQGYYAILGGGRGRWRNALTKAAPLSIGIVTLRYGGAPAVAFWTRLAQREGLFAGDPAFALMSYLEGRIGGNVPAPELARGVAGAWNAEYESRLLARVLVRDRTAPIKILGTPFDGRGVRRA